MQLSFFQVSQILQICLFDQYQNLSPRIDTEKSVFIVDIDDDSLEKLGQWPWPRFILSDLIKILNDEYQVAAIGFDILFSEKDRLSPSIVFEVHLRLHLKGQLQSLRLRLPLLQL